MESYDFIDMVLFPLFSSKGCFRSPASRPKNAWGEEINVIQEVLGA